MAHPIVIDCKLIEGLPTALLELADFIVRTVEEPAEEVEGRIVENYRAIILVKGLPSRGMLDNSALLQIIELFFKDFRDALGRLLNLYDPYSGGAFTKTQLLDAFSLMDYLVRG